MITRRKFLGGLVGSGMLARVSKNTTTNPPKAHASPIDREALINRHNPVIRKLDPSSPLSLGNGEFAFTADITGLQTFPREYESALPLCTMSQWGWHSKPMPAGLDPKSFRLTQYDTNGRPVGYHTSSEGQKELYNWLRENPHRVHLGQIGF